MNRHPAIERRDIRTTRRTLLAIVGGSVVATLPAVVQVNAATTTTTPIPVASPVIAPDTAAYRFDVRLNTATRVLDGTATIAWRNTTGRSQASLYLRCYPNASYYNDGAMTVSPVHVEGYPTQPSAPSDDPTVLAIPLGRSVAPGGQIGVELAFQTIVPSGASGSFGIFGIDQARGSWSLADWYPILAGWEPEREAWYLDAPTPFGDPTFPETATYDITFETATGFALAHTGTLVSRQSHGTTTTWQVSTGAVREFAMMLLPEVSNTDGRLERHPVSPAATPVASAFGIRSNDGFLAGRHPSAARGAGFLATPYERTQMHSRSSGEADRVSARSFPHEIPRGGGEPSVSLLCYADEAIPDLVEVILDTATTLLPHYAALLGPGDASGITIASAHLAGANGVSWPGLICLDLTILVRDGALGEEERPGLRFTVAHEVGHQWIGGVLGLNSNDHGFMLEGFTNALAVGVIREAWGAEAAIEAMGRFVAGPYSGLVRDGRDLRADEALNSETNTVLRSLAVYGKAGLGFEAIRQAMGNDAWRSALSTFAPSFRHRIFTPGDLRTAFTDAANDPAAIAELWTFWFEQEKTGLPDIDPIVQGAGA